jgi:hypothetical protein
LDITEVVEQLRSAHAADEQRSHRRARYWLTGLAIKTRVVKLREYLNKMTEADIVFLRHDPNIGEAEGELRKLAAELLRLADAFGSAALLAQANGASAEPIKRRALG